VEQHRLADPSQVVVPLLASFLPGLLLTVGSLELLRGRSKLARRGSSAASFNWWCWPLDWWRPRRRST